MGWRDHLKISFLLRAADAMAFAVYSGEVDSEVIAAAERVASKWFRLKVDLEMKLAAKKGNADDLLVPDFLKRT